jgi:transcriptional regulator with XRE-family HTH domain
MMITMRRTNGDSGEKKGRRARRKKDPKSNPGYAAFAAHIRDWLERHNISQFDLATRAGLAPATLSSWLLLETAPTNIVLLECLSDATGEDLHRYISLITNKPYHGSLVEKSADAAELDQLQRRLDELKAKIMA